MPLYLYQEVLEDGTAGEVFEVLQGMREPPLTVHPETGRPVQRLFGVPNAPTGWTDSQGKAKISDKNLDRMGFTKYVKSDTGKYEKVVGKGPSKISRPPSQ
jgi:predicted nucleic acid-binding Zn ribbon protein